MDRHRLRVDDFVEHFDQTDAWELYGEDSDSDFGVLSDAFEVSPRDTVVLMMYNIVAAALRYQRQNLYGGKIGPLARHPQNDPVGDRYDPMGMVFRCTPMPVFARLYDVNVSFFVQQMRHLGFCRLNIAAGDADVDDVVTVLFPAVLFRLTGRVSAFVQFGRHRGKRNKKGELLCFPDVDDARDVDFFLDYFAATSRATSTSSWISGQHSGALPKSRSSVDAYTKLIKTVSLSLRETVTAMLSPHPEDPDPREHAVGRLHELLGTADPLHSNKRGSGAFLACKIIGDLDEVFRCTFGPVKTVHPGYGGLLGIRCILRHLKKFDESRLQRLVEIVKDEDVGGRGRVWSDRAAAVPDGVRQRKPRQQHSCLERIKLARPNGKAPMAAPVGAKGESVDRCDGLPSASSRSFRERKPPLSLEYRAALLSIKEELEKLDEVALKGLGLCRVKLDGLDPNFNDGEDPIVWPNHRPLDYSDLEHIACKLKVILMMTTPLRAGNIPQPSSPHCHPVSGDLEEFLLQELCQVFKVVVEVYDELRLGNCLPLLPKVAWILSRTIEPSVLGEQNAVASHTGAVYPL
jgi:hypothetical protein